MENARKDERAKPYHAPLLLDKEGRVIGRVEDISMSGIALLGRGDPPKQGDEMEGWIDAPRLGDEPDAFVAVEGRCAWAKAEPGGWYRAGWSLESLGAVEQARLKALIEALDT